MAEPVSKAEAKLHLRVLHDDEDDLITALIIAAREWVEHYTGHILVQRVVTQQLRWSRPTLFAWPIAADAEVTVSYLDNDGAPQTLADARLIFGNGYAQIAPAFGSNWPAASGPVRAEVQAGYATPADVPQSLKQAMLLLIGHWFANREAVSDKATSEVPMAVEALCHPYRAVLIG